jgi:hypothetical protein
MVFLIDDDVRDRASAVGHGRWRQRTLDDPGVVIERSCSGFLSVHCRSQQQADHDRHGQQSEQNSRPRDSHASDRHRGREAIPVSACVSNLHLFRPIANPLARCAAATWGSMSLRCPLRPKRRKPRNRRASNSAPQRIRTSDLRFRRPTLYPAELGAHLQRFGHFRLSATARGRCLVPFLSGWPSWECSRLFGVQALQAALPTLPRIRATH